MLTLRIRSQCLRQLKQTRKMSVVAFLERHSFRNPLTSMKSAYRSPFLCCKVQRHMCSHYNSKNVTKLKTEIDDMSNEKEGDTDTSLIAGIVAKKELNNRQNQAQVRQDAEMDQSLHSLTERYKAMTRDIGSLYQDELENGTVDLTEEESLNAVTDSNDFVEELQLDEPQKVPPKQKSKGIRSIYGSEDPSIPFSNAPCAGCGAKLHCQNCAIPGYMPKEKFVQSTEKELKRMLCQKCYLMNYRNFCLNVRAGAEQYSELISSLRYRRGLLVLVVDITDITNSVIQNLPSLVGKQRKYFVIGNKVDLLPGKPTENLHHCKSVLHDWCIKSGIGSQGSTIKHLCLVSAKTGYGIEELINKLLKVFDHTREGDVFLLGSTNSGKSTLFNALLSSDYCKYHVRDVIHRATVSRWPGTTIDLLKFPIISATSERLYWRTQRLLKERAEKIAKGKELLKKTRNPMLLKNAPLTGNIGQTDFRRNYDKEPKETDDEISFQDLIVPPSYTFTADGDLTVGSLTKQELRRETAADRRARDVKEGLLEQLSHSQWLFDTPGLVNSDQVINILEPEELPVVFPVQVIQPRSFVLNPGQVMFVSGLGRIDYIQGLMSVYFTVMSNRRVPIHVIDPKVEDPDKFYDEALGTKRLGVPLGTADRLLRIPSLIGQEFSIIGKGWKQSAADIILSSIGFVSVTTVTGMCVRVRAYTPGGKGCRLRSPPLLPTAINMRGKRIRGTQAYVVRKTKNSTAPQED